MKGQRTVDWAMGDQNRCATRVAGAWARGDDTDEDVAVATTMATARIGGQSGSGNSLAGSRESRLRSGRG